MGNGRLDPLASDSSRPDGLLSVGRIGRPHGVHGEVFVDLSTDVVERVAAGGELWAGGRWLRIESSRPSGSRFLVRFEGVVGREQAGALTLTELFAAPIDDADQMWVHELIGSQVRDVDGVERGRCVSVIANPAADLLELDSGALVPMTFVVETAAGSITVDPPEGLFELFEDTAGGEEQR